MHVKPPGSNLHAPEFRDVSAGSTQGELTWEPIFFLID